MGHSQNGEDVLTLANLPEHTSFDLNLLLAGGNSLDAELFMIRVSNPDNTGLDTLFNVSFANAGDGATFNSGQFPGGAPDTGVMLLDDGSDVLPASTPGSIDGDVVFNLGLPDELDGIAHTADTLIVELSYGPDQPLGNEFFHIDNFEIILFEIILNGVVLPEVPEPSTLSLLAFGIVFVMSRERKRRHLHKM